MDPHSAIFIVADEGDFTNNAVNGGWDSPAGCCDSPVVPAGDPDISAGLARRGLRRRTGASDRGRPQRPAPPCEQRPYNHYSLLRTIEDAWNLPELGSPATTPKSTP